jgi:hypothetical protein
MLGGHVFEHYERVSQLASSALVQVHFLDADTFIAGGLDAGNVVDQRRQKCAFIGKRCRNLFSVSVTDGCDFCFGQSFTEQY